jgi:uncharacterized membrane protein YgdD (TMEM256/DUF423 family)
MPLWIFVAALGGFLAVALGAFAAHGLQGRLDPGALTLIETAARYLALHALALLGLGILGRQSSPVPARLTWAAWAFMAGMVLFSGSLSLMGLFGWRWLGPVTPIGGILFLAGWALLAIYAWRDLRRS